MAKARKEIDKDSMYQKIMPSAMRTVQPAAEEPEAAIPVERAAPRPKAPPSAGRASATAASRAARAAALAAEPEEEQSAPAAPAPAAPSPAAPAPVESQAQIPIVNLMERLIEAKLDIAIEKFHCCSCERCRQDITAMALNKLQPRYLVADPELLAQGMEDKEANTQVTTALVQAILKVKSNPKHEPKA